MLPLFLESTGYGLVFAAAAAIWYVPELIGTFTQRSGRFPSPHDRGSAAWLVLSLWAGLLLGFGLAIAVPAAAIAWARPELFALGIALMLGGTALRWYAIRCLGRFFTRDVNVQPGQTVVQSGPYRWIRHPSYTGTMLVAVGIGLVLCNWLSLAVVAAGAVFGHLVRVQVEEQALQIELGEPYLDYMRHTRRFIPFLW
jgi:protein-S-isoprenylcysteine O-methyltransferase Ste14